MSENDLLVFGEADSAVAEVVDSFVLQRNKSVCEQVSIENTCTQSTNETFSIFHTQQTEETEYSATSNQGPFSSCDPDFDEYSDSSSISNERAENEKEKEYNGTVAPQVDLVRFVFNITYNFVKRYSAPTQPALRRMKIG